MFDYVELPSGPCKHLVYAVLGPRLMAFDGMKRQLPIDMNMFDSWFRTLVEAPAELVKRLNHQRSHRLGFYHESLWHFFLDNFPQFEVITHNLPVRNEERTLGEFDFIVRDRHDGQVFHLEVATKYYLEHTFSGDTFWIGPSLQDRFDIKANHLINHQINLSDTPEGSNSLASFGVLSPKKVIAVGGTLFYRSSVLAQGEFIAPEHRSAKHITLHEFEQREDNTQWLLVSRKHWLAPLYQKSKEVDPLSKDEIINHLGHEFSNESQPVMVAKMEPCKRRNYFLKEKERLFITPNDWAQKADTSLIDAGIANTSSN